MPGKSEIEWTDKTWNPVTGCTKVSPGCRNCYAETLTRRWAGKEFVPWTAKAQGEAGQPAVTLRPDRLEQPLKWRKPQRIFVNSMSDLFHEDVPDEFIAQTFVTMMLAKDHTHQILTKRADRMSDLVPRLKALMRDVMYQAIKSYDNGGPEPWFFRRQGRHHGAPRDYWIERWYNDHTENDPKNPHLDWRNWPLRNVWLGVSVENQRYADERIPLLLQTPAAVRFISAEPLLGPVDLTRIDYGWQLEATLRDYKAWRGHAPVELEPSERHPKGTAFLDILNGYWDDGWDVGKDAERLDWVIVGGESGPKARPMHPDWVRSLRDQCQAAGVPFFFKQWGRWIPLVDNGPLEPADRYVGIDGAIRAGDWVEDTDVAMRPVGKGKAGHYLDNMVYQQFSEVR